MAFPTLTQCLRLFTTIVLGISLHIVSAGAVAGQSVHGRLVDVGTEAGIDRAFIVLLDEEAIEVNRVITDFSGEFSVAAPAAGRYRLRSERIGFQSALSEVFELSMNEGREVVMNVRPIVILLDTIRVDGGSKECRVTVEQGLATATVWDEARKHLAAVAWSESEQHFEYELPDFERYRERSGEVTTETDSVYAATRSVAYRSWPIANLQDRGYGFVGGGSYMLYAPDAHEFFSEEFLRAHCFNLIRDDNHVGLIGLEFEPVESGYVSDIRGVFWLDEMTSTTRFLELHYTNLRPRAFEKGAEARVEFEQIPNGPWFVSRWWIRAPQMERIVFGFERWGVVGYKEDGGEVLRVTSRDGILLFDATADRMENARHLNSRS